MKPESSGGHCQHRLPGFDGHQLEGFLGKSEFRNGLGDESFKFGIKGDRGFCRQAKDSLGVVLESNVNVVGVGKESDEGVDESCEVHVVPLCCYVSPCLQ